MAVGLPDGQERKEDHGDTEGYGNDDFGGYAMRGCWGGLLRCSKRRSFPQSAIGTWEKWHEASGRQRFQESCGGRRVLVMFEGCALSQISGITGK